MVQQPEHIVSDSLKHPVIWPEENRIKISRETWDGLVAKYGKEKVGRYYKVNPNGL